MSEPADLDDLARRYLDLWQDQMSALAADEDFARLMQRIMGGMGMTAAAGPAAWPALMAAMRAGARGERAGDGDERHATGTDGPRAPAGAAAPAPASDGGGPGLDRLARRVAALEKRLAALEAAGPGARGGARKPARKRRS